MSDLVERLREATTVIDVQFHRHAIEGVMLEAADEIERLRAELAQKPLPNDQISGIARECVKAGRSVEWACRQVERAHGIVEAQK